MSRGPGLDGGLHFLVGLPRRPTMQASDLALLARLRPAGIVLFRDNFRHDLGYAGWRAALARLLDEVRAAVGRPRLLVAIDHEGGDVMRVPEPITPFGFPREWADPTLARAVGRAMGIELASLGIDIDLAPSVDVNSNPDNPVIGRRAFGTEPDPVIRAAAAFLDGLESTGLLGCLKHFPGHGATGTDPHYGLPSVDLDLAALGRTDLAPFRALVGGRRPVMTAHIMFPAIDPGVPATLSRVLIDGVLRGQLGHRGVVISDDMNMGAIARHFGGADLAVRALQAGIDLVCVCAHFGDIAPALDWAAELDAARRDGRLDPARLAASAARVEDLLRAAPQPAPRLLDTATLAHHRTLAPLHVRGSKRTEGGGAGTI
jgi:beta-N-acetylhexosaminidase